MTTLKDTNHRRITFFSRLTAIALVIFAFAAAVSAQTAIVNDGHGKEWRQVADTAGMTWDAVAQACPRDGASRCTGPVLGEWTWATDAQVLELMSYTEPDMATNRNVSGMKYFFTGQQFLSAPNFRPTFASCGTYSCGAYVSGWTATTDDAGLPVVGYASWGNTNVSIGGSFGVDGAASNGGGGVWLFRDANGIFAYDDYGQVDSPDGGVAVANVLSNDRLAGAQATFSNVFATQVSSNNTGVSLNAGTGAVTVAGGTPAGTYSLVYSICAIANASLCDTGTVTIVVNPYTVDAVDDYGVISPSVGGSAIASVFSNDTFSRRAANRSNVSLALVSVTPNNGAVTLDPSDGSVDVARGAAVGTYSVVYRICALADSSVCDQATATVTVQKYSIDAVNDYVRASSKTASSPLNVLTNDRFNNGSATTAKVKITQLSAPVSGITLNTVTGVVSVAPKTSGNIYNIVYRICEIADPANCDDATATIELSGKL